MHLKDIEGKYRMKEKNKNKIKKWNEENIKQDKILALEVLQVYYFEVKKFSINMRREQGKKRSGGGKSETF